MKRTWTVSHIAVLCFLSALLRVAFTLWSGEPSVRHMEDYNIATNLAKGRGYSLGDASASHPTALKAPVYPLFLAAVILAAPSSAEETSCAIVQHVLIAFCPLLLFLLLTRYVPNRVAGLSAIILLFHPSYIVYPSTLESTNVFIPLSLVWLAAVHGVLANGRDADRSRVHAVLFGLASALLVLCQPLTLPIVVGTLILLARRSFPITVAAVFFVLCWSPWIIRNAVVFHGFIPLKSPVWMNVAAGFDTRSHGMSDMTFLNPRDQARLDSVHHSGTDVTRETAYRELSVQAIGEHPAGFCLKTAAQAVRYWTFPPSYDRAWFGIPFILGRLVPVGFLGVMLLLSLRHRKAYPHVLSPILLILGYFTVVYALTHTSNIRFKLDVEWLQCVAAGIVVHQWWKRRDRLREDVQNDSF